jgi:formyltetrahydrofolate deformylase
MEICSWAPKNYCHYGRCVDAPGVIHAMSSALLGTQSNILEQAQYTDEATGLFSMRTRFETPQDDVEEVRAILVVNMAKFDPIMSLRREDEQRRALIMVSQQDHCLADLLYRHANGELPIDIPVTAKTKEASERELLELIDQHDIDVVVLARYMQILSKELCATLEGRIINIHHSFLPGFKGAQPYQQAYDRGVKLIGATAHFVTADLDEGPIIEQNVHRVQHNHSAADLAEIGRDVERLVLARAVRLYAEDRVLLDGQRTVIFA